MNQNYVVAERYYLQSISPKIPETFLNLGFLYHYGLGTPVDNKKAFEYFDKAATQGLSQAEYHLGIHYRDGRGVRKNSDIANYWFRKAKANGLIETDHLNESFAIREPDDVHLYVQN